MLARLGLSPEKYWYARHVRRAGAESMTLGDSATCTRAELKP
jgi:hypothetical protein